MSSCVSHAEMDSEKKLVFLVVINFSLSTLKIHISTLLEQVTLSTLKILKISIYLKKEVVFKPGLWESV